jgi:hypothetical protein
MVKHTVHQEITDTVFVPGLLLKYIYLKSFLIIYRKYAKSDHLPKVVDEVVRETVDLIINKHGLNKPFEPKLLVFNMLANIVGTILFSQKYVHITMILRFQIFDNG